MPSTGVSSQWNRQARAPSGSEIIRPTATAITVSWMCCLVASAIENSTPGFQWVNTQCHQIQPS